MSMPPMNPAFAAEPADQGNVHAADESRLRIGLVLDHQAGDRAHQERALVLGERLADDVRGGGKPADRTVDESEVRGGEVRRDSADGALVAEPDREDQPAAPAGERPQHLLLVHAGTRREVFQLYIVPVVHP
jgi:hypothetical protein